MTAAPKGVAGGSTCPRCYGTRVAKVMIHHAGGSYQQHVPCDNCNRRADVVDPQDPAEVAYWNFDARRKGYAEWKGKPMSERDAFKAEYRAALAKAGAA